MQIESRSHILYRARIVNTVVRKRFEVDVEAEARGGDRARETLFSMCDPVYSYIYF